MDSVIAYLKVRVTVDSIKEILNLVAVFYLKAMITYAVCAIITFADEAVKCFVNLKLLGIRKF